MKLANNLNINYQRSEMDIHIYTERRGTAQLVFCSDVTLMHKYHVLYTVLDNKGFSYLWIHYVLTWINCLA